MILICLTEKKNFTEVFGCFTCGEGSWSQISESVGFIEARESNSRTSLEWNQSSTYYIDGVGSRSWCLKKKKGLSS